MANLNDSVISQDLDGADELVQDLKSMRSVPTTSSRNDVSVYFGDLSNHLIEQIEKYPVIVGCVAWLTNEKILESLKPKDFVSLVVQKEDFLRPDTGDWYKEKIRRQYSELPGIIRNYEGCYNSFSKDTYTSSFGHIIDKLNMQGWGSDAIRVFGEEKKGDLTSPRMHHKFIVFCDYASVKPPYWWSDYHKDELSANYNEKVVSPQSVWTGSFNFTHNGENSIENGLLISDPSIVSAYFDEWQYIFALSESIDICRWQYDWTPPKFRIGT